MSRDGQLLRFPSDIPGRELDLYNVACLNVPISVSGPLTDAFSALVSTYRSVSRRQAWASLRKFCAFLALTRDPSATMRSRTVLKDFLASLLQYLKRSTSISHYNFIAALYQWLGTNDTDRAITWLNVDAGPSGLPREVESTRRNHLSKAELGRIIAASKIGIEEVRSRIPTDNGRAPTHRPEALAAAEFRHLVGMRRGAEQGVLGKPALTRAGFIPFSARYRELRRYLFMDTRDLIPYILYIICETLANPNSAMELSIHCVRDHPVDPLKRRMFWEKHRASEQQALDVTVEGRYAIPRLVEELRHSSRLLRPYAKAHSDRLFLSPFQDHARTPSVQSWHNALQQFIQENNLPDFNFVDIRSSGAQVLGAEGLAIGTIQAKMQHREPRTTLRYLGQTQSKPNERQAIAKFIGRVVTEAAEINDRRYETSIGLECVDERSGTAPGSTVGAPCVEYLHCVACPNSVAVIDSEKYVARMLAALRALDDMAHRASRSAELLSRYQAAFRQTHEVLLELLAKVPKRVLAIAKSAADQLPLLPLE